MSKAARTRQKQLNTQRNVESTPLWETRSRKPLPGGRVPGIDRSMWLYRSVPMSNITDAKSIEDAVAGGSPIHMALEEIAALTTSRAPNRRMVKNQYREVHMLLVNIPTWFKAIPGSLTEDYLNRQFSDTLVIRRILLFGVKLRPVTGAGQDSSWKESVMETLVHGGTPLSDFDKDYNELDAIFARAGFAVPEQHDFALANAWWNHGNSADTPILPHEEHLHFFRKMDAVRMAEDAGLAQCKPWPEIPDQATLTFASVQDFDLRYVDVQDQFSRWVPPLLDAGTRVISIRGLVEPARVTRQELKAQTRRYRNDIAEAAEKNKMSKADQEEREAELSELEGAYARDEASATLVDTSVIIGIDGQVEDITQVGSGVTVLNPMVNRQSQAWHETMLCSSIRANPHLHDLPVTTIAYSGLPALTAVGDSSGALLGFTERDRQPVYIAPRAASSGDKFPIMLCSAATGAGKTILLQWMAHQFALLGRPVIIIDPKTDSDLGPTVELSGGQVASLDDFIRSDGALDPIRFARNKDVGVQMAASMLAQVNPWGSVFLRQQYETDVADAIRHGVSKGATATGQALQIAVDDGIISREITDPVFKMANSYPMFRATFGINPGTESIAVRNGITLFKVGEAQLKRPTAAEMLDLSNADPLVRTSVNVIRMMVLGSMMALSGRGGVLNIDEAWLVERATPDALEEIGRLARSQDVLPILYTQTPSGPIKLGLKGYMSRGLIGHILDVDEARAGLELFEADSDQLIARVKAKESNNKRLNYNSLKALYVEDEFGNRTYKRGSVFLHSDLDDRIAPVEIVIPASFMRLASTTPDEVAKRNADIAAAKAAGYEGSFDELDWDADRGDFQ